MDLHRALILHLSATYLLRVAETSVRPRIQPGDIALIDRALRPHHNNVVLVHLGSDARSTFLITDNASEQGLRSIRPGEGIESSRQSWLSTPMEKRW